MSLAAENKLDNVLDGFEKIKRYWDKSQGVQTAKILPGEYYVTRNNEIIETVLGSCISACVRDKKLKIGGMNHFMLPANNSGQDSWTSLSTRYGNFAMEHMINDILKNGGVKSNLEVKITGGGKMFDSSNDIGLNNITFVREYLEIEKLKILSEDVGDIYPRKVRYCPITGLLKVKKLKSLNNEVVAQEKQYSQEIVSEPSVTGEIELF